MGCKLPESSTSEAYQALEISHIVSKIIPTADFGYQRLKSLMIDIQYDETSLISCDNHFMSITNTYVTRLNSSRIQNLKNNRSHISYSNCELTYVTTGIENHVTLH